MASQVKGRLVGRFAPRRLLAMGLVATASGGAGLLVAVAGGLGLAGVLPALFVVVSSLGFVLPDATTLALAGHPPTAGSASALLGVLQFTVGAAATPLVGVAGATTALPMALVIATLGLAALASCALLSTAHVAAR